MSLKLQILDDKKFTCHSCGNCCRHWHVQLLQNEIEPTANLRWHKDNPIAGQIIYLEHNGQTFLKHKPNGDCIFLNSDNGLCQIHEQFGESEKPLGCQLFPFQLHRTFKDKVTLIPRHDCPSVRQNKGDRYKANQLTKIAEKLLADQDPISKQQRCGLNEDQIQAIVDFLTALLPSLQTPAHKALFLHSFCDWLSHQEASELSRQTLGQLYQPLVEHVNQWVDDMQNKKFRKVDRFAFTNLIAMYLRRDEDVLDKRVGRGKRAAKILLFGLGLATINDLGSMYPPPPGSSDLGSSNPGSSKSSSSRQLFLEPHNANINLQPLDQLVKTRLQTFGFMGAANFELDLLDGLRSLCLLYPLVMGVTKLFAFTSEPLDQAIGAVDHAFGRAAALRTTASHRMARQLLTPDTFAKLMTNL